MSRFRTAAKFFTIGLVTGLVFAPESGAQLRARLTSALRSYIPGERQGE